MYISNENRSGILLERKKNNDNIQSVRQKIFVYLNIYYGTTNAINDRIKLAVRHC